MAQPRFVYGDGLASDRIADVLLHGELRQPEFNAVPAVALA
jgi:hypothetical protein